MRAQELMIDNTANNLANVNTTGFKRDRAVFEDLLYQSIRQPGGQTGPDTQLPTGLMLGTGTRLVATEKNHVQGNMITTGNALVEVCEQIKKLHPVDAAPPVQSPPLGAAA